MIYQCYFHPSQQTRLFPNPPYRPFGLEPAVNPFLTRNCPEMDEPAHRLNLLEFAAMLHLWRNPPHDGDDWIGFTSWRQCEKCPTVFLPGEIESALQRAGVVCWLRLTFPVTVAAHAEACHPGLMGFLTRMFQELHLGDPEIYARTQTGIFASYWAVRRADFEAYMRWFYPAMAYCLRHVQDDPYLRSHRKAASYALERLFMVWCAQTGQRVLDLTGGPADDPRRWAEPEGALAWQEVEQRFQSERQNLAGDIHRHLDLLYRYASGCDHVTEFGTRHGVSTTAFLRALPRRLVCYDLERQPEVDWLDRRAVQLGVEFAFRLEDTRTAVIEPTDLLFVDTWHTYEQVRAELVGKENLVRKYLIFHDTETFGEVGEDPQQLGIWPAVAAFLRRCPAWRLVQPTPACYGLTVLARF